MRLVLIGGPDGFDDLVLHQFQIPGFAAQQGTDSVVEPEGIYEYVVDLAQFVLGSMFIVPAADQRSLAGPHIVDQFGLGGDVLLQDCVAEADAGRLMGVTAAKAGKMILAGKPHGAHVGIGVLAGVVAFHKVESSVDDMGKPAVQCIADAQELLSAGVGRADDTAVVMDDLDQQNDGKPAQFEDGQFDTGGHDDQHVPGVNGVVFDPLKDYEILRFVRKFLIVAVRLIGIVIGDQHTVKSLLLQYFYIFK